MSGHSKWATIKRKKSAQDARRGKIFTKLIKEITVAARIGGGDPETNPRLRNAIQAAKDENMPNDNIEKAIKRGTGDLPGVNYEEAFYEGYGPGGIALYIKTLTDNKNRTIAELRYLMDRHGGSMGEAGSVSWMFDMKGFIVVSEDEVDEDTLFELAIEAGAEDLVRQNGYYEITTDPHDLEDVRSTLEESGVKYEKSQITEIPQNTLKLDDENGRKAIKLIDALEDHDDVQNVYTNYDVPDHLLEEE
jgi:YebC/PmpR family DNA-binding regulatory protein